LPAVAECVAAHVPRLEIDVRFLADDRMVIFHDSLVDESTTGSGRIDAMDWPQTEALRYRQDTSVGICRLEDVVQVIATCDMLLQVDLKLMRPMSIARRRALVRALEPVGAQVIVGSQAHWNLRDLGGLRVALDPTLEWHYAPGRRAELTPARLGVHGLWDDAPIASIRHATLAEYFRARIEDIVGLLPQAAEWMVDIQTLRYLASHGCPLGNELHARGIELAAWTMRDEGRETSGALLRELFELGADTIITDDSAVLGGYAAALL
jgi:glycerophosphoryl diester phosphodiesterase